MSFRPICLFFTTAVGTFAPAQAPAYTGLLENSLADERKIVVITLAPHNLREAFCYVSAKKAIERNGTDQFPILDGVKLYGVVHLKIVIRSDGSVDDLSVVKSSGIAELDAAAKRIVISVAPFKGCAERGVARVAPAWEIEYRFSFGKESGMLNAE